MEKQKEDLGERTAQVLVCKGSLCGGNMRERFNERDFNDSVLELDGELIEGVRVEARTSSCFKKCVGEGNIKITIDGSPSLYGHREYTRPSKKDNWFVKNFPEDYPEDPLADIHPLGDDPKQTVYDVIRNYILQHDLEQN